MRDCLLRRWRSPIGANVAGHMARRSIHPLCQVPAALQLSRDLLRCHALVLGEVLGVLPLEELNSVLRVGLAAEVAISGGLLVLGFAEGQGLRNGTRSAIEG